MADLPDPGTVFDRFEDKNLKRRMRCCKPPLSDWLQAFYQMRQDGKKVPYGVIAAEAVAAGLSISESLIGKHFLEHIPRDLPVFEDDEAS